MIAGFIKKIISSNSVFFAPLCTIVILFCACVPSHLAFAEQQWESREVIAAFPKNFPPHCFLDEQGVPTGFAIDVLNEVSELANLKVTYKPMDTFVEAVIALQNGSADLIPNSGITANRLRDSDFTLPVESFEIVIFVRETTHGIMSLEDLDGRKVAYLPINVGENIVKQRERIRGVLYEEISTALFDLLAGKVDAFIYPKPPALMLAREARIEDRIQIAGPPLMEIKRAIRLRKGDPLLGRLNAVLEKFLRSPDYQRIYTKWYGRPLPFWTVKRVAGVMTALLLFSLLAMFVWRYRSLSGFNSRLREEVVIRKQAEEELRQYQDHLEEVVQQRTAALSDSEERFRCLSEAAFEGIVISEKDRILEANVAFCVLSGYQLAELLTMSLVDCLPPEEHDRVREKIRSGSEQIYESVLICKNGSRLPIEIHTRVFTFHGKKAWVTAIRDISEWKKARDGLAESEARLKEAQRIAQIGSWEWDIDSNALYWSAETYRIFQIKPQELPVDFDMFLGAVHTDDRQRVKDAIDQAVRTKVEQWTIDYRIIWPNDEVRFLHEEARSVVAPDGRVIRRHGTVQDITERKLVEQSLAMREHEYHTLLDHIPDLIVRYDTELRRTYVNPAWVKASGLSYDEVINVPAPAIKRVEHPVISEYEEKLKRVLAKGTTETCAFFWKNAYGTELYLEYIIVAEHDRSGRISGALAIGRDLSERKRADEKILRSDQRLRLHSELSPLGFLEWNEHFRAVEWNAACERIFGYTREEAIGRHAKDLILPPEVHEELDDIFQSLVNRSGGQHSINENITKDGRIITCEWFNTTMIDTEGKVIGVASICNDITEQKRLEAKLAGYREDLEKQVKERTAELEQKNAELEQANRLFVGRELKMLELKNRIRELEAKNNYQG